MVSSQIWSRHFWSAIFGQTKFGPAYLVGPIFGPTHIWFKPILGRGHIWSNQIWSVPYLVKPDLVCAEFGAGVRQPLARGPYHKEALFTKILSTYLAEQTSIRLGS